MLILPAIIIISNRSTSGYYTEVQSKNGRASPISRGSKRQGCSAQHTGGAEVSLGLATALRNELIPAQHLMQVRLRRPVTGKMMGDNNASARSQDRLFREDLASPRMQRVSLGMLKEILAGIAELGEDKLDVNIDQALMNSKIKDGNWKLALEQALRCRTKEICSRRSWSRKCSTGRWTWSTWWNSAIERGEDHQH